MWIFKYVWWSSHCPTTTTNYELLCDVETMMGLPCVMPMLEAMQSLSKLVKKKNYFICDFEPSWYLQPLCGP
jgi:hypothetical protein